MKYIIDEKEEYDDVEDLKERVSDIIYNCITDNQLEQYIDTYNDEILINNEIYQPGTMLRLAHPFQFNEVRVDMADYLYDNFISDIEVIGVGEYHIPFIGLRIIVKEE